MKQIFSNETCSISYLKQGNPKNQSIIIFPDGPGDSFDYINLTNILLTLDLPGSDKTKFHSNKIQDMALPISKFIDKLKLSNPILIGQSFGGSLAIEISKLRKVKTLILIGAGEYFSFFEKIILSIIFFPPKFSKLLRRIYAKIISFILRLVKKPLVLQIESRNDEQLKLIGDRFNKIIWYKLPNFKSDVKTFLINAKNDNVQRKKSIKKIKSIFSNHEIVTINTHHFDFQLDLKKDNFKILTNYLNKIDK